MMTIADAAWAAGIIDGEGSIFIMVHGRKGNVESDGYERKRDNYILRVSVQSADRIMVPTLKDLFPEGAEFNLQRTDDNHSDTLKWQISGRKAANVLKELLPYLKVKKAQAEKAIFFQENYKKHWKNMTEEDYQQQALICQQLREMKFSEKIGKTLRDAQPRPTH